MIRKGTLVKWSWGNGSAEGKVEETYTSKITKTIKGSEVTRNGKRDNKALYIKQDDGDYVLKSENEVERLD
jgi:ABC-type sulfate transport system substrate-binding protein